MKRWDQEAKPVLEWSLGKAEKKNKICGTKAEEAGTHYMARLNTGQNSGKSMTNHKTMYCRLTQTSLYKVRKVFNSNAL